MSAGYVIDASAILAWCFEDERPKNADAILKKLVAAGLSAPAHWPLEITNILWQAEQRGRISGADAAAFVALLQSLGVAIDGQTPRRAWAETRAIAREEKLTTYDAAYLELAMRQQSGLVSKDADLLKAAKRRGVATLNLA
ncbi:MAG: type II toxin-antitoxin system VapC family toxin [Terricaulis silvestris]